MSSWLRWAARGAAAAAGAAAASRSPSVYAASEAEDRLRAGAPSQAEVDKLARLYPRATPDEDFPDLTGKHSLMAKILTREMYNDMRGLKTPQGYTFDQLIQPGVDCPGSPNSSSMGVAAGDQESYHVFGAFLTNLILVKHGMRAASATTRQENDLNANNLVGECRLDDRYALLCRVRVARNLRGYRLAPAITRLERREVEAAVVEACRQLGNAHSTEYTRIADMKASEIEDLVNRNVLFPKPTSQQAVTSGLAKDWPDARGICTTKNHDLCIWVNPDDHMRIISSQAGGDLRTCFSRLGLAVMGIESKLTSIGRFFQWQSDFGYLTVCPSNLGTALRCSVHLKVPRVSRHPDFPRLVHSLELRCQGTGVGGILDISNAGRMMKTETEFVSLVAAGCQKIIELEKQAEKGKLPAKLLP